MVDVWIDPGHGTIQYIGGTHPGVYDPGAPGANGAASPDEADMNWNMALYLQGYLESYGYSTALTRNNNGGIHDTLLTRQRSAVMRGERANDIGFRDTSQVVVSIHHDGNPNPGVFGSSTYWYPSSYRRLKYRDEASLQFAQAMHPFFIANVNAAVDSPLTQPCRRDLHIQRRSFFMIRDVVEPAVLCEVGLISNACQQNQLAQDGKAALIASGIAAGVSHFIFPSGGAPGLHLREPQPTGPLYAHGQGVAQRTGAVSTRSSSVLASFSEGFEGASFPPAGWTVQSAGAPAPYKWGRATDTLIVQSGSASALVAGVYSGTQDEWLVSPMVRVNVTDHGLSFFWSGNHDYSYATNATCLVRRKGAGSWTTVWSLDDEPTATPFIFRERVVDMAPFALDSVQVAFRVAGPYRLQGTFKGTTTGVPGRGGPGRLTLAASPNPSRGSVVFRGTSVGPEGGALDLGIFDLSGRRIRQLHGASSPVRFEIAWDGKAEDGTRIPPGLYFARARQGAQEVKQVLIRVE